jgi:rod shape-determining protein MreC
VPDEKTFRRRRAVFLLLVLAAFVLLTGSFVGAFGGAERGFAGIVSPIQEGASKVAKPVRDLVNWVGDTFRAKGDLKEITRERNALRFQNAQLTARLVQAGQQAGIDEIKAESALSKYGPVDAHVLVQSTSAWYRSIVIDQGTSKGIAYGNPVVGPDGVVGTVIRANGGTAVVRLITDPESGITSMVGTTLLKGPLEPSKIGAVGDLILTIPKTASISVNDPVLTAGSVSSRTDLPSHFPQGIPIGTISKIEAKDQDGQIVHVKASSDLRRLDLLTVLTAVRNGG